MVEVYHDQESFKIFHWLWQRKAHDRFHIIWVGLHAVRSDRIVHKFTLMPEKFERTRSKIYSRHAKRSNSMEDATRISSKQTEQKSTFRSTGMGESLEALHK